MVRTPRILPVLLTAALAATSPARADLLIQTDQFIGFDDDVRLTESGNGSATFTNLTTFFDDPLSFDRFDPNLGTLNRVSFDWVLDGEVRIGIFARGPTFQPGSGTVDANATLSFEVNLPGPANVSDSTFVSGSHTGSILGPPGPGASDAAGFDLPRVTGNASFDNPFILSTFIGTDPFDLLASLSLNVSNYLATGPGGYGGIESSGPRPDLDFTVTYDFTPVQVVPEAGSLFLLVAGLGAMVALRKKTD